MPEKLLSQGSLRDEKTLSSRLVSCLYLFDFCNDCGSSNFESFKIINQQIYAINAEVLADRTVLWVYMSDPFIAKKAERFHELK